MSVRHIVEDKIGKLFKFLSLWFGNDISYRMRSYIGLAFSWKRDSICADGLHSYLVMLAFPLATPFGALTRVPLLLANSVVYYRFSNYLKQTYAVLKEEEKWDVT